MQAVLPLDASCEDLEVDASLSFLDSFVSEALAKGAQAYQPPHLRGPAIQPKQQGVYFLHTNNIYVKLPPFPIILTILVITYTHTPCTVYILC